MGGFIDETGNQYSSLTVIRRAGRNRQNNATWFCRCSCGNETIVSGRSLRTGNTKSCGCLRRRVVDETGNRYGRLTAVKQIPNNSRRAKWLCRCDCGNEKVVSGTSLRTGRTKSCGCLQRENRYLPVGEAAFNSLYSNYRRSAKNRDLQWELTKAQCRKLIVQPCYYCGSMPSQIYSAINGDCIHNGIDRIGPSKGYLSGNVVPCCKRCNYAKREMTLEEFGGWILSVYAHRFKGQESIKLMYRNCNVKNAKS